jgi:hypothetical protein
MPAPSCCALAATILALGLQGCFATPRLWLGEVASDEDFDTRADELRPTEVRGIELDAGDLLLWIDAESTSEALGGWIHPGSPELLVLRLSTRDSPLAHLYPDLPLLDATTLGLLVIGKERAETGSPSVPIRARCTLWGSARDPLFVERFEEEFRRFELAREQRWVLWDPAFSDVEKRPTLAFARESVFEPAFWSVTQVLEGTVLTAEEPRPRAELRRGLKVDLRMAPVAPPDDALTLMLKVVVTPIALGVDAALLGLALLPMFFGYGSGSPGFS